MTATRTRAWTLMVRMVLAAMVAIPSAPYAAGAGNKWISLRYRYKLGQTLEYAVTMSMSGTMTISAAGSQQTAPVNTKLKTNVKIRVVEVDRQGTAVLQVIYDEINVDAEEMGQTVNVRMGASGVKAYSGGQLLFDSSRGGAGQEALPIGEVFGALPGGMQFTDLFSKGITWKMTKLGQVTGLDAFSPAPGAGFGIKLSEQIPLPEKLVRPGDGWTGLVSMPAVAAGRGRLPQLVTNYTFEGVQDYRGCSCAKIVNKSAADLSEQPVGQQGTPTVKASSFRVSGEGTAYLDLEQGRELYEEGEVSFEMAGAELVGLPVPPAATGAVPPPSAGMKLSMKTRYQIELRR